MDFEDEKLLMLAQRIIRQTQYSDLGKRKPNYFISDKSSAEAVCLFKITELVFKRSDGCGEKLTTVLNSLHSCGAACFLLLQCQNGRTDIYIGAANKNRPGNAYFLNILREVMRMGIEGNLPGTELEEIISCEEIDIKLKQCIDNGFDSQCITAISCVPAEVDENSSADGIERLLEAVGKKNFSIMILADSVDPEKMEAVRCGYENLGTQLFPLEQYSVSVQEGTNKTWSESYSKSFSESMGKNISLTQSHTSGSGWSSATDDKKSRQNKLISAGAGLLTGEYIAMSAMSSILNRPQRSESGHDDESKSIQAGYNKGTQETEQVGGGKSVSDSTGTTTSSNMKNYRVKNLIERVNWYIEWLNKRENYGMFNSCAYVISSSAEINLMIASQYQALMQGKREMSQPAAINTWTNGTGAETVREYLLNFTHPKFSFDGVDDAEEFFTPAMLLSSKELSRQMALPQSPIVGLNVYEYASFGREPVRKTPLRNGSLLRIGDVSHMGKTLKNQPVILDLQSMAAHTFVAGTNGSGKSNAVFKILEELMAADIPFLVIEPAKGEYKNVFGSDPGVHVYGTNRKKTELMHINPFWFNDDVNILEHIDKLVDVFNASWSMYAAMPAVLKAAIENAYRSCGWDLTESECYGDKRFPTVRDVLAEFNSKMESTAFSQEVKGNYVGALSTRMESLSNGVFGEIFCESNLSDEELFDSNIIIDLSRIGSAETKSMIMGMLIIRLQEYRMSSEAMNLPLKHITVLEEAHHLLRATSFAQSSEGSNMLGKSVEMISNAIAEMRSYGEGFIIVDQSPGLLDMSVMRNTNTKIILRLPEAGDREAVGNTMGLSPEQIYEISRFKTGLCVIYQKDWVAAVLCQVDMAEHKEAIYSYTPAENSDLQRSRLKESRGTAFFALCPINFKAADIPYEKLKEAADELMKGGPADADLSRLLCRYMTDGKIRARGELQPYLNVLQGVINGNMVWKNTFENVRNNDTEAWDKKMRTVLKRSISADIDTETSLMSLFLQGRGSNPAIKRFYNEWYRKFYFSR